MMNPARITLTYREPETMALARIAALTELCDYYIIIDYQWHPHHQGDLEKRKGYPVSPLMDRNKGGITVSQPGVSGRHGSIRGE